jgi:energy-coupling factor transport system permease protein
MLFVYQPGDSFMHRMDSMSKFIWMITITAIVVVASRSVENIAMFLWLIFVGIVLSKLNPILFIKRLLPLTIVALWLLLIILIFYPRGQTPLATVGPFHLTFEGLDYGLALFFRVMCLGSVSIIFGLTTEPRRLINEMVELGHIPYRWSYAVYAAIRFVPLLQTEAGNILNAHAVRGAAEKKRSFTDIFKPITRLTLPLLTSGIRRVQITAIAMDSRAFGAFPKRTNIDEIVAPLSGRIFMAIHILVFILVLIWHLFFGGGTLISPIVT